MAIRINLIVLRVADQERAVAFYRALGLEFIRHRHGTGPEHYVSEHVGEQAEIVFELYPLAADGIVSAGARIGFSVDSLDTIVTALEAGGGKVVSSPQNSPWGRRAIIDDPDGHRIELTESV